MLVSDILLNTLQIHCLQLRVSFDDLELNESLEMHLINFVDLHGEYLKRVEVVFPHEYKEVESFW